MSTTCNSVFIATSLDGYIADRDGGIDWLHTTPNPQNLDLGYGEFMKTTDALVMGRKTYETVLGFDVDWPYAKDVFVLSSSRLTIPSHLTDCVIQLQGPLGGILGQIHALGYHRLYIDGGTTIQNFLAEDLIDEMVITQLPILLGGGTPLFNLLPDSLAFELVKSEVLLEQLCQNHYRRKRS